MMKKDGLYIGYSIAKQDAEVFTNKRGLAKFLGISVDTVSRKLKYNDIAISKSYIIWSDKAIQTGKQKGRFK
jgi:hypothetical protein